jgi:hypothetical protein
MAGISLLLSLLLPSVAFPATLDADGTTIIRFEERAAPGISKQSIMPATQYLGIDANGIGVKELSFHFAGWGRVDLGKDSGETTNPSSTDGNFTYGYLQYRFAKANAQIKAGRFFAYEGVVAEQVDGVYGRTDLAGGFTIAAFGGVPVKLDNDKSFKGKVIGGGRLGWRYGGMIDIGLSGVHEMEATLDTLAKEDRQIVGGDIWFSPHKMVDFTGRYSYNATSHDTADVSFLLGIRPMSGLTAAIDYSDVKSNGFSTFSNLWLSTFNSTSNDKIQSIGGSVTYAIAKPVEVTVDYKHFKRDSEGSSDRFGGECRLTLLDGSVKTGLGYHYVSGGGDINSYNQIRGFALYDAPRYTASLDAITDLYDKEISYKKDAYEIMASLGYKFRPGITLSADVSYGENPNYQEQFKGLIRLTFAHTTVKGGAPQ